MSATNTKSAKSTVPTIVTDIDDRKLSVATVPEFIFELAQTKKKGMTFSRSRLEELARKAAKSKLGLHADSKLPQDIWEKIVECVGTLSEVERNRMKRKGFASVSRTAVRSSFSIAKLGEEGDVKDAYSERFERVNLSQLEKARRVQELVAEYSNTLSTWEKEKDSEWFKDNESRVNLMEAKLKRAKHAVKFFMEELEAMKEAEAIAAKELKK
jgi:hypothetical protein